MNSNRWGAARRARVQHAVERYLEMGGFPEVQHFTDEQRRQVVRNYVDVVLLRDGTEIDFAYADEPRGAVQLIQVCWSLRDERTLAREVGSLKSAMRALRVEKGLIVTWMEESNPGDEITAIPFWKWAARR